MSNVSAAAVGDDVVHRGETHTVKANCGNLTSSGNWFCATHSEAFANQLQKDTHIGTGTHVLAWNCHLHGFEVP